MESISYSDSNNKNSMTLQTVFTSPLSSVFLNSSSCQKIRKYFSASSKRVKESLSSKSLVNLKRKLKKSLIPARMSIQHKPSSISNEGNVSTKIIVDNGIHINVVAEEALKNIVKLECPICSLKGESFRFYELIQCKHKVCNSCLARYIYELIFNNTGEKFNCPCCNETLHPTDVRFIVMNWVDSNFVEDFPGMKILEKFSKEQIIDKYETMSTFRTLSSFANVCWCPGPGCSFGVIVPTKSYCPKTTCPISNCGVVFCTNCRSLWHPDISCRVNNQNILRNIFTITNSQSSNTDLNEEERISIEEIKFCPKCRSPISKIKDGSCNHMKCYLCGTQFCWLCLKPADRFHFNLYHSGCSYYGVKRMSRSKRYIIDTIAIITLPVILFSGALVAVPICFFGFPVFLYLQTKNSLKSKSFSNLKKRIITGGYTVLGILISPIATPIIIITVSSVLLYKVYIYQIYRTLKYQMKKYHKVFLDHNAFKL